MLLLTTVSFTTPIVELDNVESSNETTYTGTTSDGTLSAVDVKPGINFFTGTSDVATFDNEAETDNFYIASERGKYTNYERTNLNDGTYNNVLSFYRAGYTETRYNWAGIGFKNTSFDEAND